MKIESSGYVIKDAPGFPEIRVQKTERLGDGVVIELHEDPSADDPRMFSMAEAKTLRDALSLAIRRGQKIARPGE